MVNWLIGWIVNWLVSWFVNWLIDSLIGWLNGVESFLPTQYQSIISVGTVSQSFPSPVQAHKLTDGSRQALELSITEAV